MKSLLTAALVLAASTFADHGMPYGPTRFENGQNLGAAPAFTQVQASGIRLVAPKGFAEAELKLSALPPPPPPEGEPIAQGASDPAAGTASSEAVGQDQPATQAQ